MVYGEIFALTAKGKFSPQKKILNSKRKFSIQKKILNSKKKENSELRKKSSTHNVMDIKLFLKELEGNVNIFRPGSF